MANYYRWGISLGPIAVAQNPPDPDPDPDPPPPDPGGGGGGGSDPPPAGTYAPYSVQGNRIIGPDGNTDFMAYGANIGVDQGIGGNNWADMNTNARIPEIREWNWGILRMTVYVARETSWIGDTQTFTSPYKYGRQHAINQTFKLAKTYADAGIVVMLCAMDTTAGISGNTEGKVQDIEDFFSQGGTYFKDQPRVWFNVNEPAATNSFITNFQTYNARWYNALRNTGAQNIYVIDTMTSAQDAIFAGPNAGKIYDSRVGPAFLANSGGTPRTNVVFSSHVYGGQMQSSDSQAAYNTNYQTYWQTCRDAGLAMVIGEFGYRVDGLDTSGGTADTGRNQKGSRAAMTIGSQMGIPLMVWHSTYDVSGLKNTLDAGHGNCRPFWYPTSSGDLSPMGQELWNVSHPTGG